MSRGGARHKAKAYIDPSLLLQVMGNHGDLLADLGSYESRNKQGAVDPAGLVRCLPLVKGLLGVCPRAEVPSAPLRQALLSLLTSMPEVNKSKFNGSTWSSLKAERLTTLFAHVRRLKRDNDQMRICAAKLSGSSYTSLQEAIGMVTLPEEEEPLEKGEEASLKKEIAAKPPLQKGKAADEISVDSHGVPLIFCTPDKAGSSSSRPKPFINRREGTMVHRHSSQALQKALGYGTTEPAAALAKGKVPAKTLPKGKGKSNNASAKALGKGKGDKAAAKALAKGKGKGKKASAKALAKGKRDGKASAKALGKGKASAKALAKGQKRPLEKGSEGPWYALRKTNAKKPKRTYITGVLAPGSGHPRKLIVEVPATWSSQHDLICNKIMKALEKDSLSKAEALKMREELVAAYP